MIVYYILQAYVLGLVFLFGAFYMRSYCDKTPPIVLSVSEKTEQLELLYKKTMIELKVDIRSSSAATLSMRKKL